MNQVFITIFVVALSVQTIFASSCTETLEERDLDYFDYYDSRTEEVAIASAIITCVNVSSVVNLPLSPVYTHFSQKYPQFLKISQSKVKSIPKEAFASFHSISKLYLSGLYLRSIKVGAFENLTKLEELYLDDNALVHLPDNVFEPLAALKKLDLSKNLLMSVDNLNFANHGNLTLLNLECNLLVHFQKGLFVGLKSLALLSLSNNRFVEFPMIAFLREDKWALDKLEFLDMSVLRIKTFDVDLSNTSIKFLNLSLNEFENFDFAKIPFDVSEIDLSKNRISTFTNIEQLEAAVMHFNNNKIRFLKGMLCEKGTLHLSHNLLESLEGTIFNKSCRGIKLSYNQISKIGVEVFSDLKFLGELYIDHNQLIEIIPGMFRNMERLETLDLSFNQIEQFQLGVFETLSSLKVVDLSNNKLTNLDQLIFVPLSSLTEIHLDSNQISSFDVEALPLHCNKLERISLDYNPWSCKNLAEIYYKLKKNRIDIEMGRSFHVENFHGIACKNLKEVDRPMGGNFSMENLYREFQKAINKGVQDSKVTSLFNKDFKNSNFFHYFNKSESKVLVSKNTTYNKTLVAVNVVQIILSVLLLFMICLIFHKLRKSRHIGSLSEFTSQTQLYYKP